MLFRIADSFPTALRKLNGQEQKAVKTTVFDLQLDSLTPGLKFHRIDKSREANLWSVRACRNVRVIVHKTSDSFLVCYVGHHDDAYRWAERRRIETHPKTGAVQVVEVRERVEEKALQSHQVAAQRMFTAEADRPLFAHYDNEALLGYGVPEDWLDDVRAATEDSLLELTDHLPQEAAEALLDLAVGQVPQQAVPSPEATADPFAHPDAQRRFRVMENVEELERALDYPWDQWSVFLHPSQRQVMEQDYSGPARVSGSAGTGKTVVAIHRAARLLKQDPNARLLLTTFSWPLANALSSKLRILTGSDNAIVPRVTILPFKGVAADLFTLAFRHEPKPAKQEEVEAALNTAAKELDLTEFPARFLMSEWSNVVDAWQITSLDAYRDVPRLGRKNRLSAKRRERIWPVFERTREKLESRGVLSWPMIFGKATAYFAAKHDKPFTHAVVDEAQDLSIAEARFLAAACEALGVDGRGRSRTLKVKDRCSHQIRRAADRLLPQVIRDVDNNEDDRRGTVSLFNGPEPEISIADASSEEKANVAAWLEACIDEGIAPDEIGVFVRSRAEMTRAREAVIAAGQTPMELSERVEDPDGRVSIGTMHLAKGLEYRAVAVMACDDDILPLQERVETVADESELDEVYETERHLFYVACTRARDHLFVSGIQPASEFIADLTLEN